MLTFGYVKFEMPIRHVSGGMEAVGCLSLAFIAVVRAGDEHLLVLGF